jgi:hypothetical protein
VGPDRPGSPGILRLTRALIASRPGVMWVRRFGATSL